MSYLYVNTVQKICIIITVRFFLVSITATFWHFLISQYIDDIFSSDMSTSHFDHSTARQEPNLSGHTFAFHLHENELSVQ